MTVSAGWRSGLQMRAKMGPCTQAKICTGPDVRLKRSQNCNKYSERPGHRLEIEASTPLLRATRLRLCGFRAFLSFS